MINFKEFEYDSFEIGENKTLAMKIITGINRMPITEQTVAAIKEIATKYNVSLFRYCYSFSIQAA